MRSHKLSIPNSMKVATNLSISVVTPNSKFQEWLTENPNFLKNIFPAKQQQVPFSAELMAEHAIAFECPQFSTDKQYNNIVDKHHNFILKRMFLSWQTNPKIWPQNQGLSFLMDRFSHKTYSGLVDLFGISDEVKGFFSLITIAPKQPVMDWIKASSPESYINIEDLDKFSFVVLAPIFTQRDEFNEFMQKQYLAFFEFGLLRVCLDNSQWPTERTFEQFSSWYDFENIFPYFKLPSDL